MAPTDNVQTNKKLWDAYAANWNPREPWVRIIAEENGRGKELLRIGDELSSKEDIELVFNDIFRPTIAATQDGSDSSRNRSIVSACEIGSGEGRIASMVAPLVSSLTAFDISKNMLSRAETALAKTSTAIGTAPSLELLRSDVRPEDAFGPKHKGRFDFVYSFDVFPRLDLHTQASYWRAIRALMRPLSSSRALVSTVNLLSPLGWKRFSNQSLGSVGGFFFTTPEIQRRLINEAGLEVVSEISSPSSAASGEGRLTGNLYYDRDYIVVVKIACP